jgi:thiol-disulfide isomerase/thioredoxin
VAPAAALLLLFLFQQPSPMNLRVSSLDGATVEFQDLRGSKLTVLAFISSKCPVSHMYQARMGRLYREYKDKGVGFVFLNSNDNESLAEIQKQVREASLPFPVYKDFHNRVADQFDAQTTPEVFLLDSMGKVVYRGAIDDSSNEARVKKHALRGAIDAVLAGKQPPNGQLKAFGCVLKRQKHTL